MNSSEQNIIEPGVPIVPATNPAATGGETSVKPKSATPPPVLTRAASSKSKEDDEKTPTTTEQEKNAKEAESFTQTQEKADEKTPEEYYKPSSPLLRDGKRWYPKVL